MVERGFGKQHFFNVANSSGFGRMILTKQNPLQKYKISSQMRRSSSCEVIQRHEVTFAMYVTRCMAQPASAASAKSQTTLELCLPGWDSSEGNSVGQGCKKAYVKPWHAEMAMVEMHVLSQVISASSREPSWFAHGHIHSKIRNRLEPATTKKLVYVYSNSKMVAATRDADKLKMLD